MEHLTNGLLVSDSSKKVDGTANGYDIKSYPVKAPSFLAKLSPGVTATQLASISGYLYQLTKAAGKTDLLLPRLLVAAQCIEFCESRDNYLHANSLTQHSPHHL
jgi:hypothetical protein